MNDVFKAIADPTRREILLNLCQAPSSVNGIAAQFDMSRPAVSKHIKILEACQLVNIKENEQDSRSRICYATLDAMKEVDAYLKQLEAFWDSKLDKLGQYLDTKP